MRSAVVPVLLLTFACLATRQLASAFAVFGRFRDDDADRNKNNGVHGVVVPKKSGTTTRTGRKSVFQRGTDRLGAAFGSMRTTVPLPAVVNGDDYECDGDNSSVRQVEEESRGGGILDVVLFGIGDLRVDDHLGLYRAIKNNGGSSSNSNSKILPLCILNDDMLSNVPGAVAHTVDTARLISAALTDLDNNLQTSLGASLNVQLTTSSLKDSLMVIRDQVKAERIRVHIHDLGDVDNGLGYGSLASMEDTLLEKDGSNNPIEIVTWNSNLRDGPWNNVEDLPEEYDVYENKYTASKAPIEPISIEVDNNYISRAFVSLDPLKSIPSSEELLDRFVSLLDLDMERCKDEHNTGLFGTHWGGLQPESVGGTTVLKELEAYVIDCKEDDKLWFRHPSYIDRRCKPNGRSLEHAAMEWQLRGDGTSPTGNAENWLAGESVVRYLAAPLLLGTVSPRRIWHMSQLQALFFPSPLKRLAEGREWHKLLAAHNIRTDPAYQHQGDKLGQAKYRYWRYHGFLCRFTQTDFTDSIESNDDSEGVVLVHGFGASGAQWNKAMKELGEMDDNVSQGFAPDLIGFGHSEKPAISYTGYMWDSMVMDFCKEQILPKYMWKSFIVGGNSIGGFTSMSFAASDAASIATRELSSSGAPGTGYCNGLVLMNSAGPVKTKEEVLDERTGAKELQLESVAQVTALNALPACKPPPRPVARAFGNVLLSYLRPQIQSICTNLYPTNPAAVDDDLCDSIYRDSLDPGAINVMISGAKLPAPRTANELLQADFGGPPPTSNSVDLIPESTFGGLVLIAQGVLDPLNDAMDRMNRFGALRKGITTDPLQAGHCPHDELPKDMARSISAWMTNTRKERFAQVVRSRSLTSTPVR